MTDRLMIWTCYAQVNSFKAIKSVGVEGIFVRWTTQRNTQTFLCAVSWQAQRLMPFRLGTNPSEAPKILAGFNRRRAMQPGPINGCGALGRISVGRLGEGLVLCPKLLVGS